MHQALDRKRWETSVAAFMRMAWFTDCKSTFDTLQRPIGRHVDKRLGIELASLRQSLWRTPGGDHINPLLCDDKPAETTDIVRWTDTSVMPADPLTKVMKDSYLREILKTNFWDFKQNEDAKEQKAQRQESRRRVAGRSEGRPSHSTRVRDSETSE